jgi:DNA transformation protein
MGFSPKYREEVEKKLSEAKMIQTKPMFGGVGIYADDLIFALIAEDKLYFKVDDSNRQDFEARGMNPFYPYESGAPMHYWELPQGVIDDPKELGVWIDKSLKVAQAASASKRKKKPASSL